ncbi:META domain-containing protein [Ostreiculturibacter nitratireducens]|uniref:META domain-containing protein n=1 Tax=Ostreiculturibacter nitratireducens TaxID=3075226 RepID=UPI0031B5ACF1
MFRRFALIFPFLAACTSDATLTSLAGEGSVWRLTELDGAEFAAEATIEFPQEGRIAGAAPCNRYTAAQSATYPDFAAGPIAATRMACPELDAETRFLDALAAMRTVEVDEDVLTLSGDAGRRMVFVRLQD